jgi:hypothetical protein
MVARETAALETLASLIHEANIELPKCQAALDPARTEHERVHRDRALGQHLHMLQELEEQRADHNTRIHALTDAFNRNEEHPVEQHVRRFDTSPMPECVTSYSASMTNVCRPTPTTRAESVAAGCEILRMPVTLCAVFCSFDHSGRASNTLRFLQMRSSGNRVRRPSYGWDHCLDNRAQERARCVPQMG